jgi:hypothetical protein
MGKKFYFCQTVSSGINRKQDIVGRKLVWVVAHVILHAGTVFASPFIGGISPHVAGHRPQRQLMKVFL